MIFGRKLSVENILINIQKEFDAEVHTILHFWIKYMLDQGRGGFFGHMSNDFKVHREHDKHVVMHLRCLWSYAIAARLFDNKEYRVLSHDLFQYTLSTFRDTEFGGFFWQSDYRGNVIDRTKFLYAQVLGISALSEYYALSGDDGALVLAMELFDIVEKRCKHVNGRSYNSAFEMDWSYLPHQQMRAGVDDVAVDVGVHLHVFGAYADLYEQSGSKSVLDALMSLEQLFLNKMYDRSTGLMHLFLNEKFNSTSTEIRPGHDIEFAWLAIRASRYFNSKLKMNAVADAIRSIDTVRAMADSKTSTLFFYKSVKGRKVKNWRWWSQAEMILALWHAYEVTGQEEYLRECWSCWRFVKRKLRIRSHGEWRWNVLSPNRGYSGYIAGDWKSPFHSVRAMSVVGKSAGERLSTYSE